LNSLKLFEYMKIMKLKVFFLIIALGLTFNNIYGQNIDSTKQTINNRTDSAKLMQLNDNTDTSDDFSPGMAFFALVGFCLILISIGAGIVITITVLFMLFGFVSVGIISASVFVGLKKKSLTKGFKTFLVLSVSIIGSIIGFVALFLINKLFHFHLTGPTILIMGSLSGLIGGIILGLVAFAVFLRLINYFKDKLQLV